MATEYRVEVAASLTGKRGKPIWVRHGEPFANQDHAVAEAARQFKSTGRWSRVTVVKTKVIWDSPQPRPRPNDTIPPEPF